MRAVERERERERCTCTTIFYNGIINHILNCILRTWGSPIELGVMHRQIRRSPKESDPPPPHRSASHAWLHNGSLFRGIGESTLMGHHCKGVVIPCSADPSELPSNRGPSCLPLAASDSSCVISPNSNLVQLEGDPSVRSVGPTSSRLVVGPSRPNMGS